MKVLSGIQDIDLVKWDALVKATSVATWFQTREAFGFFKSLSFMEAFVVAVDSDGTLKGLVVGYLQKDGGKVKQYLSRRAIILGGPLLAEDISSEELKALLQALNARTVKAHRPNMLKTFFILRCFFNPTLIYH